MMLNIMIAGGMTMMLVLLYLAFAGPSEKKASERRLNAVRLRHSSSESARVEAQLKKAVAQRKPMRVNGPGEKTRTEMLRLRLHRSGKTWTVQQYVLASLGIAVVVGGGLWLKSGQPLLGLLMGVFLAIAVPHMVVGFLISKRLASFNTKFPDAIELLVRGLRSGLPVTETLGIVSTEIPGPVGEEFKMVTERIRIGRTMEDSLQETADRLGIPEFQFFCITLAIQRETGGNLAETLSNLADVLRKRAQMKLKIRAMSSESKASAYIVGSLPFCVFGLIYTIKPEYMAGFFSEERLMVAGGGGLIWMSIGVFIMAKMVSFEI